MRAATQPLPPEHRPVRRRVAYGIVSTYPPTRCGLATFTAALTGGLLELGATVGVVRVADGGPCGDPRVLSELENGVSASIDGAIDSLAGCDVAIVQHEYGLYGGRDGDEVVEVLRGLAVPSIVVAHTVLRQPTAHQRLVLEEVADAADAVVVMTEAARRRLCSGFGVDHSKVNTIAHGATLPAPSEPAMTPTPTLLTFGLLGQGKGIEWVIDALVDLGDLRPRPRYVVAGRTHPKVALREGERYREMLTRRAWSNGVATWVTFDDTYRDVASLTRMIQAATVVVLPYDSPDQVTSGVLVEAVAAGRPVVATAFPHAVELLAGGAGLLVPHRDPVALASAVRRVLTEPGLATSMTATASRVAPSFGWTQIAAQYSDLAEALIESHAAATA